MSDQSDRRGWATRCERLELREAQLYANEHRRDHGDSQLWADLDSEGGKERKKAESEENNEGEINFCSLWFPRASQDVMDPDGPTATGPAFPSQI